MITLHVPARCEYASEYVLGQIKEHVKKAHILMYAHLQERYPEVLRIFNAKEKCIGEYEIWPGCEPNTVRLKRMNVYL